VQRVARIGLAIVEIAILSALILATRFANYQDVFVAGNVYFSDADCYARMTRVRMCEKKPGLIVRHHDFENFPQGTTPHTTAPFDYLILALAVVLKPFHRTRNRFSRRADLAAAGAVWRLVSLVVVAPYKGPVSLGGSDSLRHQSRTREGDGARTT
jgi:asparagine N-glycosylation enzyme membrane subunit Stt3